jgi:bisphosphoglycerate-independent phosphoglycerate mutase (AlkP superfamily)
MHFLLNLFNLLTVPFTCSSESFCFKKDQPTEDGQARQPALRDVAPTVLHLLGLPIPAEMDGVTLVEEAK